ncbi:neprilysin-11-like [Condylostylus longicornis]|uniref:neprilysin-11-like n=1 Tax=Condylostylus longicornis TaxID=2530218 RepID=UPI00244DDC21|nr:neprilysin-11-like [Condylostylus longicornis]
MIGNGLLRTIIFQLIFLIFFGILICAFPNPENISEVLIQNNIKNNEIIEDNIKNKDDDSKFERVRSSNLSSIVKEHIENINKYLNKSADPCEDFHEYACGNWQKYHKIPPDHASYDLFHKLNDKLRQSLHDILTIQTNLIKSDSEETKFLKKLGGFPLLDENWSENTFNIEKILIEMSLYDMQTFFAVSIFPDLRNSVDSGKYLIYVWDIDLGLPYSSDYLDSDYEEQTRIINETNTRGLSVEEQFIPKTIGILNKDYPKFNWSFYFNTLFNRNFTEDTKIIFFTGPNIQETYDILFETEKRIMANYFNWVAINKLSKYLVCQFFE